MPRISLTRRVIFAAAHRYRRPEWDDAQNEKAFGLCARPSFHGHTYTCDVTVSGPLDAQTGFVADLGVLDAILDRVVRAQLDHRNLNTDVPEFAESKLIPSGENLSQWIAERVQRELPSPAVVTRVRVSEEPSLWSTWERD
ncbi:MAG TPA: 6-carboxytetrahydropterin synthase [Gemmatimonadaceae bacterium]|nr:6-carboxytetrahydropterin synthase [Gemmatimonadaceae bacterium]